MWIDAFITKYCLRQRRTTVQFRIDIDDPSILLLFSIKHHWRHRIWLCSQVTTFGVNDTGPFIPGVGSHHQDPYKLNTFERPQYQYDRWSMYSDVVNCFAPSFGTTAADDDDNDDDNIGIVAMYKYPCNESLFFYSEFDDDDDDNHASSFTVTDLVVDVVEVIL